MDSSRIASYNGAPISIHGLGANSILDAGGNVRIENGKPVVVAGVIVQENGHSVIQVNGQTLEFKHNPVILDGAQSLTNTAPVTVHLSMVEQGGMLLRGADGQPLQVLRVEVPLNAAKTLTGFDPVLVNGQLVLVAADGTVMLVPVNQVEQVQSLPGFVTVGSSATVRATSGTPLGILTLGGGGIDVFAKGNIDVEKSRVSTFFGGDINLTSTEGDINAGSGSRNESVTQTIEQKIGNDIVRVTIQVPASGISTFHPDDPRPLTFIKFNDPEITALQKEADRQSFFGHTAEAAALLARANELQKQREPVFNETVLKPYINSLKLGDVTLVSERGSVIIPSAGIQGRTLQVIAPKIDNQGGPIIGNFIIPATATLSGPPLSITGTASGGVSTPITPVSGSAASASVSATTAAVSTSAKSSESVQETTTETASQKAQSKQVASNKDNEKDRKSQLAKSVRMKHGVVIQVDVKPAQ